MTCQAQVRFLSPSSTKLRIILFRRLQKQELKKKKNKSSVSEQRHDWEGEATVHSELLYRKKDGDAASDSGGGGLVWFGCGECFE